MKNKIKLFGIIALAAAMTFAMTSCSDGGGGGPSGIPYTPPPPIPEEASYVSFDEATGYKYELVITENVARYIAKEGDTYVLTIYGLDETKLAESTGTVSSASTDKIELKHSTGAVITVAVSSGGNSNNAITDIKAIAADGTEIETIPVDAVGGNVPTVQKPAKLTGLAFELINNGTAYRVYKGSVTGGDVNIPASVNKLPVTEIGNFADTKITSVSIPSSAKLIKDWDSFMDCKNLTTVTFAAGSQLETIGNGAFSGCENLVGVTIPAGVTKIGGHAFMFCTSLKSIEIPASVKEINNYAFGQSGIESITFAAGSQLKTIGDMAFINSGLKSITIPASVNIIGGIDETNWGAFAHCKSLESVTFAADSQLETIGRYTFGDCTSLTSITIPSSVTSIGWNTFRNWTSSQTINVPFANWEEANAAWVGWLGFEWEAVIKYWNGSSYE